MEASSGGVPRIRMLSLEQKTSACRSCGQRVRWGITKWGAKMICQPHAAIDADGTIAASDTHWAHCPTAKQHKQQRARRDLDG